MRRLRATILFWDVHRFGQLTSAGDGSGFPPEDAPFQIGRVHSEPPVLPTARDKPHKKAILSMAV